MMTNVENVDFYRIVNWFITYLQEEAYLMSAEMRG